MKKLLLFICTGNTCRSPMAEALAKQLLPPQSQWEVASAGVFAFPGSAAAQNALTVLSEKGIDFSDFRSQQVSHDLVEEAQLIFVMTQSHYDQLLSRYPQAKKKLFLLTKELSQEDIIDPYGGSLVTYQQCAHHIEGALLKLIPTLLSY